MDDDNIKFIRVKFFKDKRELTKLLKFSYVKKDQRLKSAKVLNMFIVLDV